MGISTQTAGEIMVQGLAAIRREFEIAAEDPSQELCGEKELGIVHYILDEPALECCDKSNDGNSTIVRDRGRSGMRLAEFKHHPNAVTASLEDTHTAALRIYTSRAFRCINDPLRQATKPHPFPATTMFLSEALKKLRAVNATSDSTDTSTDSSTGGTSAVTGADTNTNTNTSTDMKKEFWRGMKNLVLTDEFRRHGGTELGCMSTSSDQRMVAGYAMSTQPLIFRVLCDDFMSCGADISWVSVYPDEAEILFPPLTYLKYARETRINNSRGVVVDVRPSFST
jgi:hypothetical protein